MRKTSDLISEMLKEAKGAFLVAIAVGFENETRFIFSSQKQPLNELNQLVQKGGAPVGLLRFEREGAQVQGSYRPFEEYKDSEWAGKYLADLLENTAGIIGLSRQAQDIPNAY